MSKSEIQAEFFNHALGLSREKFQSWFTPICALLYEGDDCIEVIPTQSDGGLDCVIPRQGVVYQIYGPDNSPPDAKIASKINEDFPKVVKTLGEVLQIWRLIINQRAQGWGQKTTIALTNLQAQYPRIAMSVWGLDQLWDELMNPTEQHQARLVKLAKILGLKDFTPDFVAKADKLLDEAQDLAAKEKYQESYDKAKQAYAILKPHGLAEPLMRVLVCLILWGGKLPLGDSLRRYGEEMDILLPQVSNRYTLAIGDAIREKSGRRRGFTWGYATRLQEEVITFMQTEARELIAAGKLLIVPASVVGCISPGWGPMEQGIAEAGNAIPGTRAKFDEIMGVGSLPYSPDLPIPALLEFADKYEAEFLEIRKNLAARVAAYRQVGDESTDQRLQRDIQDLLKMAEAKQSTDKISKKERIAKEAIGFATSPFRNGLRLDAKPNAPKTFEPLLVLQTMGYGWKMGKLDTNENQPPYQVSKGETVGAWLCLPLPGTLIPMMRKAEEQK